MSTGPRGGNANVTDERLRGERSVCLFALAFLALNFPILSIFEQDAALFGVPALYAYLFVLWAVLIILAFASLWQRKTGPRGGEET